LFDPSRGEQEIIETHISTIAFDGEFAHKRKKPVRFPFVDLSTSALREADCRREFALNRRFAPDVYLGVEDVVDASGKVEDHAVRMRRMPHGRRLSALIRSTQDVSLCIRQVARSIAVAHADAPTSDEISSVATHPALTHLWDQNLRELEPFAPTPLDGDDLSRIADHAHRYLDGRVQLLGDRIRRGRVLDGHGDLLADDIFCLDDGPRILDCLEFDDRLRWGDVLYDVGFLAMDLERLGRPDLAREFLDRYREYSAETHPISLEHHYIAYRALVRSKISCLRGQPQDQDDARSYLRLCERHLERARVRLVLIGGLPGTGKSTLAARLGDELGWAVLRSDEIRKSGAGLDPRASASAPYREGLYAPSITEDTYAALFDRAAALLSRGECVILDASFSERRWRAAAAEVARTTASELVELRCAVSSEIAERRLRRREAERSDPSDADAAIAAAMRRDFDPWPSSTEVDTRPPPLVVASEVRVQLEPKRD
jgi:aminoglycoside phosphotransferase family enzyme/predicted kinase